MYARIDNFKERVVCKTKVSKHKAKVYMGSFKRIKLSIPDPDLSYQQKQTLLFLSL